MSKKNGFIVIKSRRKILLGILFCCIFIALSLFGLFPGPESPEAMMRRILLELRGEEEKTTMVSNISMLLFSVPGLFLLLVALFRGEHNPLSYDVWVRFLGYILIVTSLSNIYEMDDAKELYFGLSHFYSPKFSGDYSPNILNLFILPLGMLLFIFGIESWLSYKNTKLSSKKEIESKNNETSSKKEIGSKNNETSSKKEIGSKMKLFKIK